MRSGPPLRCIAIAALLLGGGEAALAEEPAVTPTVESPQHKEVEQIAPLEGGDAIRVDEIAPTTGVGVGVGVEQAGGRDLCDPSVSPAQRLAAGVDCERSIEATDAEQQGGRPPNSLLEPRGEDLKEEFDALDLGEDVPATFILQQ